MNQAKYASTSYFWIEPSTESALFTVSDDVISAWCGLAVEMQIALNETRNEVGDLQSSLFDHLIESGSSLASARVTLFKLLTAISSEQKINRFCYFELPKEAAEAIEKLQPAEKFLVVAAFRGCKDAKSSHIYEG